jgi:hypothetical protein
MVITIEAEIVNGRMKARRNMTYQANQLGNTSGNGAADGLGPAMNVGNIERTVSILAGAVGLLLLSRRLFVYVSQALISAYAIYRGVTGRCALYERAKINTRGQDGLVAEATQELRAAGAQMVDRIGADETEAAEIEKWIERERAQDMVEQSSWESFPASDPPGGGVA